MSFVKRPIISEKSVSLNEKGIYTFEVPLRATKEEIRREIESLFSVKVDSVRTIIARGKSKVTRWNRLIPARKWKKAYVKLAEGYKIGLLEGV